MTLARCLVVLWMASVIVGCVGGDPAGSTASSGSVAVASSTATTTASEPSPTATVTPSSSIGTIAPFFQAFDGFTFREAAPEDLEGFESAVAASIGDAGSLGEAHIAEAVRGDEPAVTVIAFSLVPSGDATEQTLFGLMIDSIAGSLGGEWAPALDGQAFALETADQTVIVLPWATSQDGTTLFLLLTAPPDAPVEDVARGMTG